jgi:hypothetical protein
MRRVDSAPRQARIPLTIRRGEPAAGPRRSAMSSTSPPPFAKRRCRLGRVRREHTVEPFGSTPRAPVQCPRLKACVESNDTPGEHANRLAQVVRARDSRVAPGRRDRRAARRARIPTAPRRRGGGRAPERAARDRSRRARGAANTWRDFYGVISLANDGIQALDRGLQIGTNGANNTRARGVDRVARAAARSRAAAVRLSPAGARASRAAAGARAKVGSRPIPTA